ncbi:membrane progestin receptor delta-like [Oculina patagonica]
MTTRLTRKGKLTQIERNGEVSSHDPVDLDKNLNKNGVVKDGTARLQNHSRILRDYQIPPAYRDKCLVSRYRPRNLSALECAKSMFYTNNESVNFWSHILSIVLLLARYGSIVWYHNPSTDHFYFPLTSFTLGCCTLYSMSCLAHMFSSMTEREFHIGYYLDYAAISVYTFTAGQAFYFYCHPLGSGFLLYDWRELFLFISALVSFGATYSCCRSRHRWLHARFIIRTGSHIVSWAYNCSPYIIRQLIFCSSDPVCNPNSVRLFTGCFLSFGIAAVLNMTRVPERFAPGLFDFIGHSHNLLHVFTTLGDHFAYSVFLSDLAARKEALAAEDIPSFFETIGLTQLVLAGNLLIVFWFARSLRLTSHSDSKHSKSS